MSDLCKICGMDVFGCRCYDTNTSHGRDNPFSREAWESTEESREVQRVRIYEAIKKRPQTNEELIESTGIVEKSITGTTLALRKQGFTILKGWRRTKAGNRAAINHVNDAPGPTLEELRELDD